MGSRSSPAFGGLALIAGLLLPLLAPRETEARVLQLEIERRTPILEGRSFEARGAYELLEGRIEFGFEPANESNARVSDIELAPRGPDGLVHAESPFRVLQPIDPARRRGTALVEVVNRGRPLLLGSLNRAALDFRDARFDPSREADLGDGFLMKQGLTLVWIGWQHDAPPTPGALRLTVPRARQPDGSAIRGLVRSDWVVEAATDRLSLAVPGHVAQPVAERDAPENRLTVRADREGARETLPRGRWHFDESGTSIVLEGGFTPGRIYELVYVAHDPPVVGLGFAAFRDVASFLRYDPRSPFSADRAVAIGISQSGRFLRHLLYEGFNLDEAGRRVYDGAVIQIAGGGRGSFNHRFAQPGRVGNPFRNFFYPGDDFPFASRPTSNPLARGSRDERVGHFDRLQARGAMPRLFQINTGYEYWARVASLVQMTPDGQRDLAPLASERLYHIASAPHYPLPFPPRAESETAPGIYRGSPLETSSIARALLLHLLAWVEADQAPPPSRLPRIDTGTLVERPALRNPVPGLVLPRTPHVAYALDFGPDFERGILAHQPPQRGPRYAIRVPQLDALGNELGGIRVPALRVPIGSYLPFALRTGEPVAPDEMLDYLGSFAPFSRTPAERAARRDPRPSLDELYDSEASYTAQVEQALADMIAEGFLLEADRDYERRAARLRWDWITSPR